MHYETKKILLKLYKQSQENGVIRDMLSRVLTYSGDLINISDEIFITKRDAEELDKEVQSLGLSSEDAVNFVDKRICTLNFKNFRAFPGDKYGISFSQNRGDGNNLACSLFLVGSNSNGKSTICDALEYAYTGDVAAVHRLKDVDLRKFLTYGFEEGSVKKEDVALTLRMVGDSEPSVIDLITPIEPSCTSSCFCSDSDVEELERCEEDFGGYLLTQLGYGELAILRDKLTNSISKIKKDLDKVSSSAFTEGELRKVIDAYLKVHYSKGKKILVEDLLKRQNLSELVEDIYTYLKDVQAPEKKDSANSRDRLGDIRSAFKQIPKDYFVEEWNQLINNIIADEQNSIKNVRQFLSGFSANKNVESSDGKKVAPVESSMEKLRRLYERLGKVLADTDGLGVIYNELANANYGGLADVRSNQEELQRLRGYVNNITRLTDILREEEERICDIFYKVNHDYLKSVMDSFSRSTEKFSLGISGNHLTAKITSTDNGGFHGTPKTYYNTFRFKLFVIALKISLAFLYMRTKKVVVPIVIDDVFNATDFDNSIKLERFVYQIYRTYEEIVNSDIPLQLIVLSHDEMVMMAFRRGAKLMQDHKMTITDVRRNTQVACNDFVCGRLFHYTQADELNVGCKYKTNYANLYMSI